jgi:hypothetical protein
MRDHLAIGSALALKRRNDEVARLPRELRPSADIERLAVAATVLSRFVGEGAAKRCGDIYQLQRGLLEYAWISGQELDARPHGRGPTVLRKHGFDRPSVRVEWSRLRGLYGIHATLGSELLFALFQPAVWRALLLLIDDGPATAVRQIEQVLNKAVATPVQTQSGQRPRSRETLKNLAWSLTWVTKALVDMQTRGFGCGALRAWAHAPPPRIPDAPQADTDTSSPPLRLVRLKAQELDAEVGTKLKAPTVGAELEAVRSCSTDRLCNGGIWELLRFRALFLLTFVIGGRSGAVCELRRRDLVAEHVGRDGRVGPAVALRPGKIVHELEVHWKPIPPELFKRIEVFRIATDRILAESPKYAARRARLVERDDADTRALFPKSLSQPNGPLGQGAFRLQLNGKLGGARHPHRFGLLRPDGRGYSPHSLRACGMQAVRNAGHKYCETHEPGLSPHAIYEALVDHKLPDDPYGYLGTNTLAGRERLSKIGAQLAWDMLTGNDGARTQRDHDAYRVALERRSVLAAEHARVQAAIDDTLNASPTRGRQATDKLVAVMSLHEERDRVRERLSDLDRQLDRLRNDPSTRICVPDSILDEEIVDRFKEIEKELGPSSARRDSTRELPAPVRDWLALKEVALVTGYSYQQVCRWARGESLPYPDGDPRNPWSTHPLPVDSSRGPRRKRVPVGALNSAFVSTPQQKSCLAEVLSGYPQRWARTDCTTPLVFPCPSVL